ncbi:hypothetical protein [Caminibacter pacificus]|uniref:Uncharacterized protein n=1 Tax=Caminibacter pacificus TaxID=1424653 RepID=A0AAJ4UXD7_9BACT|nr:hypothetical protein [Caminibacter pacificus]QCI28761.1 hypothetical protein C6V80_07215 [Caminibacter pacificus]ROR39348.1 hypothetical protein EDC58_1288 [Caminibacter pacificus]
MKKLVLFATAVLLFAQVNDQYLNYTNKLVNYQIKLKNIEKITPPFEIYRNEVVYKNNKTKKIIRRVIKVDLVSIFDNKAYVVLKEYLGSQLVSVKKKWVKVGDKIDKCVVSNITIDKLVIRCKDRKIVKSLNKKIPFFKESK